MEVNDMERQNMESQKARYMIFHGGGVSMDHIPNVEVMSPQGIDAFQIFETVSLSDRP